MSVTPNGFTSSSTFTDGAFEIRNVTNNTFDITASGTITKKNIENQNVDIYIKLRNSGDVG